MTEDDAERMSDMGYNCLYCRPRTGAPSPRPPTPECIQTPDVASPSMSVSQPTPIVKEEVKSYMVDGICLSEAGMSLVKEVTMEAPPTLTPAQKAAMLARQMNRKQKIKQSHPQMAQLLSACSTRKFSACVLYCLSIAHFPMYFIFW